MENYIVDLRPHGLSQGRLYNKRFPICLTRKQFSAFQTLAGGSLFDQYQTTNERRDPPNVIIIFARTNKEKEEWFRRYVRFGSH